MRALVTGGSSGIGLETAILLRRAGYHVTVADIRPVPAGIEGLDYLELDLTDPTVSSQLNALADIDVLVNNAGAGMWSPVECTPLDRLRRLFELHVLGPLALIQAVLPGMRAKRAGTIVNVSAIAAIGPFVLTGAYCASKSALMTLSEALANEVGHFGIKVRTVIPGTIVTEFASRRATVGLDEGPYVDLGRMWDALALSMRDTAGYPPEVTAQAILDAIEDPGDALVYPGSPDAAQAIAQRKSLSDAEWKQQLWQRTNLDW